MDLLFENQIIQPGLTYSFPFGIKENVGVTLSSVLVTFAITDLNGITLASGVTITETTPVPQGSFAGLEWAVGAYTGTAFNGAFTVTVDSGDLNGFIVTATVSSEKEDIKLSNNEKKLTVKGTPYNQFVTDLQALGSSSLLCAGARGGGIRRRIICNTTNLLPQNLSGHIISEIVPIGSRVVAFGVNVDEIVSVSGAETTFTAAVSNNVGSTTLVSGIPFAVNSKVSALSDFIVTGVDGPIDRVVFQPNADDFVDGRVTYFLVVEEIVDIADIV